MGMDATKGGWDPALPWTPARPRDYAGDNANRWGWTISSDLLLLFGIMLVIVGAYFWFIRPPFLPQDLRYLATLPAKIDAAAPNLKTWLGYVFRVLGGYDVASGILRIALAGTSYGEHRASAAIAAAAAGAASIGLMTWSTFRSNRTSSGLFCPWRCFGMYTVEVFRASRTMMNPTDAFASLRGYERQYSEAALLDATAAEVFAFADDFKKLSSHMAGSSKMMMGSSM